MSRKVALITGVTGQDGSYLTELLLSKGYEVHGLIRRSSTFNTSRIDHIYQDPHDTDPKLFLHYGDLIDGVGLTNLVREIKPTEVYNLGAQSHVQVSFTMPQYTGQVDAVGAVGLLEAIRSASRRALSRPEPEDTLGRRWQGVQRTPWVGGGRAFRGHLGEKVAGRPASCV